MPEPTVPRYWSSIDWEQLIRDYPPPPDFTDHTRSMSDDEVRQLQEDRFLARVAECWTVPFYERRWRAAGLEPGDITTLSDIGRIPSFTSDDIKEAIEEDPPFGSHQSFAFERGIPLKLQTSGGTSGLPRPTLFDPIAWEVQGIQYARAFFAQGGRPGQFLQITLTDSLANAGWASTVGALHWLGMIPMTTGSGSVTASKRQLELAREWGTSGWVAFGEYLKILAQTAREEGIDLRRELPTTFIHSYLGVDEGGALRSLLEQEWGAKVYDNYGTHEVGLVAFECEHQNGLHVNEDTAIIEMVDPTSGDPVDDGQIGNIVVTSLHRSVPPIIRYDLKDILRKYPREQCACGLRTSKLSGFLGRSDEMIKLRGTNIHPRSATETILAHPATTGEFLCVVTSEGEGLGEREVMTLRIETVRDQSDERLREELAQAVKAVYGVRVEVELVEPGALSAYTGLGGEGKVKRLLDLRRA